MVEIETRKEIKFDFITKEITQQQTQEEMIKLGNYLKENIIKKVGPLISSTYGIVIEQ